MVYLLLEAKLDVDNFIVDNSKQFKLMKAMLLITIIHGMFLTGMMLAALQDMGFTRLTG